MIKAILTKPLDGQPEGTEREFDQADFDALKAMGAVREVEAPDLRDDGPTIEEYLAAGYKAENYPPKGYASRSTPEEIDAAVAAAAAAEQSSAKKAPETANKAAPAVANKAGKA